MAERTARVVDVSTKEDVTVVQIEVQGEARPLIPPIAPAALYAEDDPAREVYQLHRLLHEEGDRLTFETYRDTSAEAPEVGHRYVFRSWWLEDALELVEDTSLEWTLERYPDNGDHDFCPLTYGDICGKPDCAACQHEGYRSGNRWITVDAYQRFIRDDVLRLRRGGGDR